MEEALNRVVTAESMQSNVDYVDSILNWDVMPTDLRYLDNSFVSISPMEPITITGQAYTFKLPRMNNLHYTYINELFCALKVSILKKVKNTTAWVPLETSDDISPCPWFLDSFFSKIDIYLQGRHITSSDDYRFISASIFKKLFFDENALGFLETELGSLERDPGDFSSSNADREKRKRLFQKDPSTNQAPQRFLLGLLTTEVSNLKEPIPNDIELVIKVFRTSTKQLLDFNGTAEPEDEYSIRIHSLNLLLRRPLLSEAIIEKHASLLAHRNIRYYWMKKEMAWTHIPIAHSTYTTTPLFANTSSLPSKLLIAFIDMDTLAGNYRKSFQKLRRPDYLKEIHLVLDNKRLATFGVPEIRDFSSGSEYFHFLEFYMTCQSYYKPNGINITFDQWKESLHCYFWDLSAAGCAVMDFMPLLRTGLLKLSFEFEQLTTEVWNIYCIGFYPSLLEISGEKAVSISCLQ